MIPRKGHKRKKGKRCRKTLPRFDSSGVAESRPEICESCWVGPVGGWGQDFSGAAARPSQATVSHSRARTHACKHAHTPPQLIRQSVRKEERRTRNSYSYTIQIRLMDAQSKARNACGKPGCAGLPSRQKPTTHSDLRGSLPQPRGAEKTKSQNESVGNLPPPCCGEKQTTALVLDTLACNWVNRTEVLEWACHDQIT